jgi:hypothetical protein
MERIWFEGIKRSVMRTFERKREVVTEGRRKLCNE